MSGGRSWVKHTQNRFQAGGFAVLLAFVASVFVAIGPVSAAPQAPCPSSAPDEAAAVQAAAACRGRVEVASARDERTEVFANASGTLTAETAAVVQRVKDPAGRWMRPDARLRADGNGRFAPAAAALNVSFSGGGNSPAVTIGAESAELSLTWPGTLPPPVVAGATATYREVLPGVDLALTAQVEGFSEVLVVKNAKAANNPDLSSVRFITETKGLELRQSAAGELTAVKTGGGLLFASGAPVMWDSSEPGQAARNAGPSTGSRLAVPGTRSAVMPVKLDSQQLIVRPDQAMLRSTATTFPVYIDPMFIRSAWTMINSRFPDQSYWSFDRQDCPKPHESAQCAKVGYTTTPQSMIYRSLFSFGLGTVMKKHITRAILSMDTLYSYNGTATATEVRVTGAISSATKWSNNASTWGPVVASAASQAYDRKPRHTEWGMTTAVRKAAGGTSSTLTLGLRVSNESSLGSWKKFNAGTAKLIVEYNSYPKPPEVLSIAEQPCKTGATRKYARTLTPTIVARLTDPDGTGRQLKGTFYWWKVGTGRSSTNMISQGSVVSGNNAVVKIPAGRLADGTTYALQSLASDGVDSSQPAHCEFTVDVTAPGTPGKPVSAAYPSDGQVHGGAGVTGAFTLKPPTTIPSDFWGYAYSLDPGVSAASATQVAAPVTSTAPTTTCSGPGQAPVPASDRSVRICVTPKVDRAYTLRVWAKDKAGNFSDPQTYSFLVAAGAGPAARWNFDDNTGADDAEHGNNATITGASFEPGRGKVGVALKANGTSTFAATAGPITTTNSAGQSITLHPNQSFTLTATVRLDSTTGTGQRVIVAQNGTRTSPFLLSYSIADKKWRFAVAAADVDVPTTGVVLSNTTAVAGAWTRLLATYDGTSRAMRLYVNGTLQTATATATATFDSAKPVTIGRGMQAGTVGGYFAGAIDDVRVYGRVVNASEMEFTNLQRPNPLLVSFPAATGNKVYAGRNLSVTVDAGGDTTVTAVRYQLGATAQTQQVAISPGGVKTLSIPVSATDTGPTDLFVQALDVAALTSTITTHEVFVETPVALKGVVLDAITQKPLAGVSVRLTPGDLTRATNANGEYSFTGIDENTYQVAADNGGVGCASARAEREILVDGDTERDLMIAPEADTFGYVCHTAATTFVQGTTRLALTGDDQSIHVPQLPFTVPYYGNTYNGVWVSTNGFVSFKDPAGRDQYNGVSLPDRRSAPIAALAPYLSDLTVDAAASVWTTVTGSGTDQRFVVEWRNTLIAGSSSRVSFEVMLAPDGDVTFNYAGLTDELTKGADSAVGITSPGGNYGLQYAFQEPSLVSGTAVTFAAPEEQIGSINGSLNGFILDSVGNPQAGAHVWLEDRAVTTDEGGLYDFGEVENGAYNFYAALGCNDVEDPGFTIDGNITADQLLGAATDTFGNRCALSTASWIPADTAVDFGDGYETPVTLPFPVSFYGHAFTSVTVQNWGAISFADPADPAIGGGMQIWPAADPVVDEQTTVLTKSLGTAPNRQLAIEWRNVALTGVTGRTDLQLILDENSSITANARNLPDRAATTKDAEIYYWGTEYNSVQYYEDGNGLRAGKTVTFSPPPVS